MNLLTDAVIDALQGTCQSLEHVLDEHNALQLRDDREFLTELDSRIFCCTQCDWWCEISEQSDDGERCDECNPEEDEE